MSRTLHPGKDSAAAPGQRVGSGGWMAQSKEAEDQPPAKAATLTTTGHPGGVFPGPQEPCPMLGLPWGTHGTSRPREGLEERTTPCNMLAEASEVQCEPLTHEDGSSLS